MAVPPAPPSVPASPGDSANASAIALLADRTHRAIIAMLVEARGRGLTTAVMTDGIPLDATPRLIRDRVRTLARAGIVTPGPDEGAPASATQWVLTGAGEDLQRVQSLIARIVAHGAGLPTTARARARETVLDRSLTMLADPVVLQVTRCLAEHGPLDPTELEQRCEPTPRRTLYRRLGNLVAGEVVLRTTTGQVPRRTTYELAAQWRPAAAVVLLAGWWEGRHSPTKTIQDFDLEGLLLSVLPSIRVPGMPSGAVLHWMIEGDGRRDVIAFAVRDEHLEVSEAAEAGASSSRKAPNASMSGRPVTWASALVTDHRDELVTRGDDRLAHAVLSGVRSGLLAYVR